MTEELMQVSGEAEMVADEAAMNDAAVTPIEGSGGSDTVVGQAARVIDPPPAGDTEVIRLAPGERFELAANPATVSLVVDGNNLVLGFDLDGNGTPDSFVILEDLVMAAAGDNPPVLMVAGQPIGVDLLIGNAQALAQADQGGPGATLETATGEAGTQGTGATAYSDNLGDAIDLLVAQGVIPPVQLEFGIPEFDDRIDILEEENDPPIADPVLTPASVVVDGGEGGGLPEDLVTALNNLSVVIQSTTVTVTGSGLAGSVQYVFFTLTEPTAVTITTDGPTIDPHMFLFRNDGSLDAADFLAEDDDDGSLAGLFRNAVINTGDEIGILPAGSYIIAVGDYQLTLAEAVAGINNSSDFGSQTGDVTVTVAASPNPESIVFFKKFVVDGEIGDDDSGIVADFGGADSETSLENLVFTLQSNPTFGQLILVTAGGATSFLTPGDTFSSEDTVWWIATESQIADFLALPGSPEFLPDVDFLYAVTDEAGASAVAPVVITLPPPQDPRASLGVFQDDCLSEDTEGKLLFAAHPTDGASKISEIVISGFPTGDVADAWVVDAGSVDIFGYTFGVDYTASYNAVTGELTITFITASFSLGEAVQGTVDVTPNPDSDVDQTLTIEATAINGAGSATDVEDSVIVVDAIADGAEGGSGDDGDSAHLSVVATVTDSEGEVPENGSFHAGEVGTLTVHATFDDFLDGSETHTLYVYAPTGFEILGLIGDLPAGVTLTASGPGFMIFDVETLNGVGVVDLSFQVQNVSAGEGEATFYAYATAEETNTPSLIPGDQECDGGEGSNFAYVVDDAVATVAGIAAPTVSINLEGDATYIKEDSEDNVVEFSAATGDASDELTTVVITFPPEVGAGDIDFSAVAAHGDVANVDIDDNGGAGPVVVTITFNPGVTSFSGDFLLDAPVEDSDVDLGDITIVANVQDQVVNSLTDSANATLQIDVDAVLDAAVDPGADSVVNETEIAGPQTINLGLAATLGSAGFALSGAGGEDTDGSESITVVLVLNNALPGGVTLSSTGGTVTQDLVNDPSGKTYIITGADLEAAINGLQVQLPASFEGTISGTVTATSAEANTPEGEEAASGAEPDETDNVVVLSADFTVNVADGADPTGSQLNLTVDEKALDLVQDGSDLAAGTTFGNNAGSTAETTSGGLTFNAGADPIVDIYFGATGGIVVQDEDGNPINVVWSGVGTDTLTGTLNGVVVIVLSLSGDNTAAAGGTADVTVTATLTDAFPHDFGNTGDVSIAGILVSAEDDDGDIGNSTVNVTVLDDEPNDISPDKAVIGSGTGSTTTGDLDFYDNAGADKNGDVKFDASALHNMQLFQSDGVTPVTSNGLNIYTQVSGDGHTLTAYADVDGSGTVNAGDTVVFTAVLNPNAVNEGADEYTITLFDEIDTGAGLLFDNFGDVSAGGPKEFIALDDPRTGAEDLGEDILITASPESGKVNASTQGVGVANQQVDAGETIRVDFVSNVVGLTDATPGIKDDFVNLTYSGHRTVNDSGFNISQDFGPTTVKVKAIDADDDKDFGGDPDDIQRNITLVTVISAAGIVLLDNVAANASNGGVSVTFNGDGTVTVSGLLEDYQVLVSTAEGFDALEITAVASKFDLGGIVTSSAQAGEPVDLDLGLIATDEDGDTSSGTLEVTVLPQIDGGAGAENLAAGSNGGNIQAGDGNDTLVGGAANDLLQGEGGADTISDGDGNDIIIGGDGADIINLANDGDTDILVYNAISEAGDVVNGFSTAAPNLGGAGGDVIDLVDLLDGGSFTGTTLAEAQSGGYVELLQSGLNVQVRVDLDGGGNSYTTIVTINNVSVADLSDNIVVD